MFLTYILVHWRRRYPYTSLRGKKIDLPSHISRNLESVYLWATGNTFQTVSKVLIYFIRNFRNILWTYCHILAFSGLSISPASAIGEHSLHVMATQPRGWNKCLSHRGMHEWVQPSHCDPRCTVCTVHNMLDLQKISNTILYINLMYVYWFCDEDMWALLCKMFSWWTTGLILYM